MSDILKNNAISDDELGRVSGGVVDMTPEQLIAARKYVAMFRQYPIEQVMAVINMGFYENNAQQLKDECGIDDEEELIEFIKNEWGV